MLIALSATKILPHWLQCPDCKGYFDPNNDPHATVADGFDEKTLCINCLELAGEIVCDDCGELIAPGEDVDGYLCEDCACEAGWAKCEGCDEWVDSDDVHSAPGGDSYCGQCFGEYYSYCGDCGEVFYCEDMVARNDDLYCTGCRGGCADDFDPSGFDRRIGCTTEIGSERCFGVELETNMCDDYSALVGSDAWGVKEDSTVSGKEFFSDILDGDAGLDAITDLVEIAMLNDWDVDDSCGFHLHLDARYECDDSLYAAAYAYRKTEELWHSFVERDRDDNTYSHRARWDLCDLDSYVDRGNSFMRFILDYTVDRYEWLNLRAYNSHTTLEVRLHHGSINGIEICNWIKAHTRFMDWATTAGFDGVREALDGKNNAGLFDFIVEEVWKDDTLRDYYAKKSVFMRDAVYAA